VTLVKWIFRAAGAIGLLVLLPMYFLENRIGVDLPPRITHPEYFYGFIGVALAWQFAFLIISTDPVRYRPLMVACLVEKFSFSVALGFLWVTARVPDAVIPSAVMDFAFGVAFLYSYLTTRSSPQVPARQSIQAL
jgi:hypothetical protein